MTINSPHKIDAYSSKDGEYHPLRLDPATNTLQTIDYPHHEIHAGSHFVYTDHVPLSSAETMEYLVTTPNTTRWAHMMFDLDGSAITQFELYEGATVSGSVAQTPGNNNRNSSTTPGVTVHKAISGSALGTRIHIYKGGSSSAQSRSGGQARNDTEIILKQNTKYVLKITSGSDNNLCNVRLEWYEHTDTG